MPLSSTTTFAQALTDPRVQAIYSEDYLAIDISAWSGSSQSLVQFLQSQTPSVPLVNQAMLPLMFIDTVGGKPLLRFPARSSPAARLPADTPSRCPS